MKDQENVSSLVASRIDQKWDLSFSHCSFFTDELKNGILSLRCYGFADDFKVPGWNQEAFDSDLTAIDDWCNQNSMIVNVRKFALVNFKGIMSCSIQGNNFPVL